MITIGVRRNTPYARIARQPLDETGIESRVRDDIEVKGFVEDCLFVGAGQIAEIEMIVENARLLGEGIVAELKNTAMIENGAARQTFGHSEGLFQNVFARRHDKSARLRDTDSIHKADQRSVLVFPK